MQSVQKVEGLEAPRILVVEDEPALRFLITEVFSGEAGFEVVEARSADEAIDVLAHDHNIDCVFTDVRMPGRRDGIELARHVLDAYPEMRVVMASGNLRPGERPDNVPFFAKPYDCFAVASYINDLLTPH
jgi:CheY-like chemotaxis protein